MELKTQLTRGSKALRPMRRASLIWLALLAWVALVPLRAAAEDGDAPPMSIAALQGTWQMTMMGQTGCGFGTAVLIVTLDATGAGMVTGNSHSAGCGDGPLGSTDQFMIHTLNADGSGTAGLSCGPSCGWVLTIQVSPNREVFTFIDVDPSNPGNFVEGTAIRRAPPIPMNH